MDENEKRHSFNRKITVEDSRPHIYIVSPSEGPDSSPVQAAAEMSRRTTDRHQEQPPVSVSFFGHSIGRLIAPGKAQAEEFTSIDEGLETGLEAVRQKLQKVRPQRFEVGGFAEEEERKHRRFIEERNAAQEALFGDIIRRHREFRTGLGREDLLSLHDLMKMEASHEAVCAAEESIHELVECDLLQFLRRKAAEHAWKQLDGYMAELRIPFPMSPSLEDPAEPLRDEKVREERKKSAEGEFMKMLPRLSAELILGNVPNWVYSYPQKPSYLWELVILQGVAAALSANVLMKYLSVWEENSREILRGIEQEFLAKIDKVRDAGESASELPEMLSISRELKRISREQIPEQIWKHILSKLESS
jgi:hypothetical protein